MPADSLRQRAAPSSAIVRLTDEVTVMSGLLVAGHTTISRDREDFDELVKKLSESTQVIPLRAYRFPEC
jgi:hypothetical protein